MMEEHLLFFWWFNQDWHQSLSLLCLRLISFNMESWLVSGAEMTVVMQLAGMVHQLKVILIFLSMKLNYMRFLYEILPFLFELQLFEDYYWTLKESELPPPLVTSWS